MDFVYTETAPEDWATLIASAGFGAGISQAEQRARVLGDRPGARPLFLRVLEAGQPRLSLLAFQHRPTLSSGKLLRSAAAWLRGRRAGFLDWHGGPVPHMEAPGRLLEALEIMLAGLDQIANERGIRKLGGSLAPVSSLNTLDGLLELAERHEFSISPWGTYLVDLDRDEEALWESLGSAARKSVRKARRHSLRAERIQTLGELKTYFYDHYLAFELGAGRSVGPFSNFEQLWRENQEGYYHFYVVRGAEDAVLATLGMNTFNRVATEIASALGPQAFEQKIPAQDFLHWEMMLAAKAMDCKYFDLAGVNPNPKSSAERGIQQFKKKWGGEYREYLRFHKTR